MIDDKEGYTGYSLPRGGDEATRLERQHAIFAAPLGFLINPTVQAALPKNAAIADVGTGTGVWLREVARSFPSENYSFHGLDLSDVQFPADKGAITYDTLNILEPIPPRFQHKFDLVHLRLLICAFRDRDWVVAARHILDLLKPGGYVQWQEISLPTVVQGKHFAGDGEPYLVQLCDMAFKLNWRAERMTRASMQLPEYLRAAGFEAVRQELFDSSRMWREGDEAIERFNENGFRAISSSASVLLPLYEDVQKEWPPEKFAEYVRESLRELKEQKMYLRVDIPVATGRKPV